MDELAESAPPAAQALRTAAEERAMLAGLYTLTDRCEEALAIWRELVAKDEGLRHWPDLVDCLLRLDRKADAKAALAEAFAAVEKAPPELRWVRRRLERIRVD